MAVFHFTSPQGKNYTVHGPDGATKEQAFQILQRQLGESAAVPQPQLEPAQMATGMLNTLPAAEQGTTPNTSYYGKPISSDVYQNDAGDVQYKDPRTGQLKTTNSATQVVLRDPADGQLKVYARSPSTNEGLVTGVARVLSMGLGASEPAQEAKAITSATKLAPLKSSDLPTAGDLHDAFVSGRKAATPNVVQPFQIADAIRTARSALSEGNLKFPQAPQTHDLLNELEHISNGRLPNGQIAPRQTVGSLYDWMTRAPYKGQPGGLDTVANETVSVPGAGPGSVKSTRDAVAAIKVKNILNDLLDQVSPGWRTANKNEAASIVANDLSKRAVKAMRGTEEGKARRIVSAAKTALNSDKAARGLSENTKGLLEKLSKGGSLSQRTAHGVTNVFRRGRWLAPIGGTYAGGLLGGLGAFVADTGAEGLSHLVENAIAKRAASKVVQSALRASPLAQEMAAKNFAQLPFYPAGLLEGPGARLPALLDFGIVHASPPKNKNNGKRQ